MANATFTDVSRTRMISVPKDWTGAAGTIEYISLKAYDRVRFVVASGAWAGSSSACSLSQATDVAATGAKELAFDYMYTNDSATSGDTLTKTAVSSNTFNIDAANSIYIVEVNASMLDKANGFDCVAIITASPSSNSDFYSVIAEVYDGRYTNEVSAIVD